MGTGGGQKEVLQPSPLQIVGNQRGGGKFGFQARRPNNQNKLVDSMGSLRQEVRGKVGQEVRVDQNSSRQGSKLDEILSNGNYITSARDDI